MIIPFLILNIYTSYIQCMDGWESPGRVCASGGQSLRFPRLAERCLYLKFATTDVCASGPQQKDLRADPLIYSLTAARIAFKWSGRSRKRDERAAAYTWMCVWIVSEREVRASGIASSRSLAFITVCPAVVGHNTRSHTQQTWLTHGKLLPFTACFFYPSWLANFMQNHK